MINSEDKVFERYAQTLHKQDVTNGLLIAQAICARKLIEEFDKNCHDVVLSIMQDIVVAMENVMEEKHD